MVNIPNPRMGSNMSHSFSNVPRADIPRTSFKRVQSYKTTFNADYLVPFYVDEVLPGDTFNLNVSMLARLATPVKPIMDNMYLDSFFFFVPNRLIYDNWEKLCGAQDNPGDSTDFLTPIITAPALSKCSYGGKYYVCKQAHTSSTALNRPSTGTNWTEYWYESGSSGSAWADATAYTAAWQQGSIEDYFGLPTGVAGLSVCSFWHRAYNLIYNNWFRDQNLQDNVVVDKDAGPDTASDYVLLRRGKRHDYFTSCLPWPQKTDDGEAVPLPLGASAPVMTLNCTGTVPSNKYFNPFMDGSGTSFNMYCDDTAGTNQTLFPHSSTATLYADLSDATAANINDLREAFQIQHLYERDARGGTRYIEILNSHFGVTSPDFRLQRSEYLGGDSTPIIVNPITQNNSTDATTPQGNLAGVGTAVGRHGFTKSFVEHGVIIGIVNVRADLTYQQGIHRMFKRRERFDFYWPALAHLGEQAVLNQEIFAQNTADDTKVFGYQERWSEYRYGQSKITGKFRSTDPESLDVWHLSQDFASLPVLNDEFIVSNTPMERVIAVTTEPHFIFDAFFSINTVRPMPTYSVPGLIDHF